MAADLKAQFESILATNGVKSIPAPTIDPAATKDAPLAAASTPPSGNTTGEVSMRTRMGIVFATIALLLLCGYMMSKRTHHAEDDGDLHLRLDAPDDHRVRNEGRRDRKDPPRVRTRDPLFQHFGT